MIYKDYQGLKLSALGIGAMRLPTVGSGRDAPIDENAAGKMVAYAIEQGINYFDTAWSYHGGQSETALGKMLGKYPREKWFLADKFPGYSLSNMDKVETIFEEQLKKCGVSYFDFYLFHNVCEMNIDAYLDEKYGIFEHLLKQREAGRIRHLGFSAHGSYGVVERFLEKYGYKMEFCQLQLNYMDWVFQDAKARVDLLDEWHIPVWVMEPMRGGQLASLSEERASKLKELRPDEKIPAWAFRFIQSIPSVLVTLSGVSTLEQLKDNVGTYQEEKPLINREMSTLLDIVDGMVKEISLPCTSCRYCVMHCPQKLDIPMLIALYNEHRSTKNGFIAPMVLSALPEEQRPKACVACRSCDAVCPQQIKIADAMSDFASLCAM